MDDAALDLLVEALGADIARIAVEIEKLSLLRRKSHRDRGRYRARWCPMRAPPPSSRW